jgi:uncharacterized protein YyaL (SSP411 family)
MNRLVEATSPYLRQHADNPVAWYPWGDEAFELAARLDLPIFVSIGYSACHWCHVMAHESFEDEETARYLNEHFVAIKVDREERPDIDAVYMESVQALTGRGGWPLNVFVMHDGRPFYGGTYFPRVAHNGGPTFVSVLEAIVDAWENKRALLIGQAGELTSSIALRLGPPPRKHTDLPDASELLDVFVARFGELFDEVNGGIKGAPKFAQAPMLELLMKAHLLGRKGALAMVEKTLSSMASGGIYDHLGGGFARYATDAAWQVPHFEKMLYDQASLSRCYLHAWRITGDERWRKVCEETLDYVLRDLVGPKGEVYCSEDADSEGKEGRFYTWTKDELEGVLGPSSASVAAKWYGIGTEANFEGGRSILHRAVVGDLLRPEDIEACRMALFAARGLRVRPGLDDKVLTEWNAMIGSVLCEAAGATDNPAYRVAAEQIASFLLKNLRRKDGRWLRSYRGGNAEHLGVAGDYAWLIEFFTRLSEDTGRAAYLHEAQACAHGLIELFAAEGGGLCMTGSDAQPLAVRPRDVFDGVTPAAGSVAANAMIRLGALLGDAMLLDFARGCARAGGEALVGSPLAVPGLVFASLGLATPPIEIVIAGERPDLLEVVRHQYLPDSVLAWGEPTGSPLWEGRENQGAYVCQDGVCLLPVDSPEALVRVLKDATSALAL